jgi:hypothetical protein
MTRQANLILPRERRDARPNPSSRDALVNGCASHAWKPQLATPGGLVVKIAVKIATHNDAAMLRRHHSFLIWDCANPGKTWIEQNKLGARVWQCKCFTPARYEKQICTSRSQPFIHAHGNSPLQ